MPENSGSWKNKERVRDQAPDFLKRYNDVDHFSLSETSFLC